VENKVFVDTAGWANLFVSTQPYHSQAREWFYRARQQQIEMVTTNYVVAELVALLNSPLRVSRSQLFQYVDSIRAANYLTLTYIDAAIETQAWNLLKRRSDKSWSLVDATSFVIMQQLNLQEALTTDRHFEQAGFVRLLK
jgi:predicted nucleic acid-binding protein